MPRSRKAADSPQLPVRIRYDGPTDSLEVTQDGVTIPRESSDYVSEEMAQHLLGCSYADVTVLAGDPPAEWPTTDRKLDELAERLGVEWPEPQNGQPPLTAADKVEHLEAAGYSPDGSQAEVTSIEKKESE